MNEICVIIFNIIQQEMLLWKTHFMAELEMRSSHVSILPSAGKIEIMFWATYSLEIKS